MGLIARKFSNNVLTYKRITQPARMMPFTLLVDCNKKTCRKRFLLTARYDREADVRFELP